MKYIAIVLAVFAVSVHSQGGPGRPPRPPPSASQRTPPKSVQQASSAPVDARPSVSLTSSVQATAAMVSPPRPAVSLSRPEGCSPGCGPTEICAKLGDSYCRPGQVCSVCIKMESIRFPASALAGMFQPPSVAPVQLPVVPQQPIVPAQTQGGMNQFSMPSQQQQQFHSNQFSYMAQPQQPVNNDPFADLFGFGPSTTQQTQQNSFGNPFDFFSSPPANQNTMNTNTNTNNNYMPLLFFEGLGFGGLGF